MLARATATFIREVQSCIFICKTYMMRHSLKKSLFYFPLLPIVPVRENNKSSICFRRRAPNFMCALVARGGHIKAFGLLAKPTGEPRKKNGDANVGCMPSRRAAQERKMETRVWTACRVEETSREEVWKRIEKWKRAFALLAVLTCEHRTTSLAVRIGRHSETRVSHSRRSIVISHDLAAVVGPQQAASVE